MSRDHRKLRAFHAADALVLEVYRISRQLPIDERFGLQAQIRRAAVSAVTNIVEGSARRSGTEYCRFLEIAHGSSRETAYLLGLAVRLKMLPAGDAEKLITRYERLDASLLSIVASLSPPR